LKLETGAELHGIWRLIDSDPLTEILSQAGFDFQIFDREHGSYDFGALESAIRLCDASGSPPIVRVTGIDRVEVQRCLDFGARGLVFPQLDSFADVSSAIATMQYAPAGTRGFNPFTRAGTYGQPGKSVEVGAPLFIPIIETLNALRELPRILELPEVDLLYLGAYDLSVHLGCRGRMEDPALLRAIEDAVTRCHAASKPVALIVNTPEQYRRWRALGVTVFVHSVDTKMISDACHASMSRLSSDS
jgi:4-hydroxy-2-oxoheptanedioate aldolase